MSEENRETQIYELEALESVLRENKLTKSNDWTDAGSEIEGSVEVVFDSLADPKVAVEGTSDAGEQFSVPLDILPPVRLKFRLPLDYPTVSCPHLNIESDWMTREQKDTCEAEMTKICEENLMMPVLFFCYQSIIDQMDAMSTRMINLNEAYALKNDGETIASLKSRILGKGEEAAEEVFLNTLFDCEVCYDSLLGQHCIKFHPCSHVFCRTCTFDYFRSLARGVISKPMQCLAEKCQSEAQQNVIKEALGEELFAKYEEEILEKAIREMDDTVECPRETCHKVAYITDRNRNLGECSYCQFSFCVLCKQTFHGVSGCKWKKGDRVRIVKQWQEGDAEARAEICRQFGGEKHVATLVERFLNEEWLDENSKPCPKCSVSIEKNEGCHKMHCTKCDTYFCWLCGEVLSKEDPYQHFQGDGLCSGRLFEGVHHIYDDNDPLLEMLDDAFDDGSDYEDDESDLGIDQLAENDDIDLEFDSDGEDFGLWRRYRVGGEFAEEAGEDEQGEENGEPTAD